MAIALGAVGFICFVAGIAWSGVMAYAISDNEESDMLTESEEVLLSLSSVTSICGVILMAAGLLVKVFSSM